MAGEMDNSMPPDGWTRRGMTTGGIWSIESTRPAGGPCAGTLALQAKVVADEELPTAMGNLAVQRIDLQGTLMSVGRQTVVPIRIMARVWYAPSLGRTVRFEFEATPSGSGLSPWRERAELTAIRRD